jgi:LysR family transcriptional regulator, nitrogen assimilation regulatory protein
MKKSILSLKGISLDRLQNFCLVADAGSIVGAVGNDPPRQSLLSRQIRELEESFEVDLIRRSGRGIVITEAGRELAAISRQYFKAMEDFQMSWHDRPIRLSLAAPNSVLQWLILPRIQLLKEKLPAVKFNLYHESNRDIIQKVQENVCDFGFIREESVPCTLRKFQLGRITFSLFVPALLNDDLPQDPLRTLSSVPLALPMGGLLREELDQLMREKGLQMDVKLECASYLDSARAVKSGVVASVLPDLAKKDLLEEEYLEIPLNIKQAARQICLIWSQRAMEARPRLKKALPEMKRILQIH